MAKNWKSFVKKESSTDQNPKSDQEALRIKQELNLSISELAKSNDDLKTILQERDALEEKMRDVLHPGSKVEKVDPRFASSVVPIHQKRQEDKKRFDIKQKLEAKIQQKNKELALWTKRRDRLKEKVKKVKNQFERRKKQADDFRKKIKSKIPDDFDYDKIGNGFKKKQDDFPFVERIYKKKEELFKKPIKRVKEIIKEKPVLKKIVDNWETIKDQQREAQKIKNKFERIIGKKNELFELKGALVDELKNAAIEKLIEKKNELKAQANKKDEEKSGLLKRLQLKRREKKKEEENERKELAKKEQLKQKKAEERKLENQRQARSEVRREEKREERKRKQKDKFYN